jgi:ABC-type transport system involved in multi-copper enzyme maturation permease subunit
VSTWARVTKAIDNPIIAKDGISRMRTWRAPVAITLYLGLLGGFGYAFFVLAVIVTPGAAVSAQIGGYVFAAMAFFQLALLGLFAPAMGAGAISGERERQTLDVLLVSQVSPFGVVWGKLVASLAFLLLLMVTSLPLFAAVFLFGGVDAQQFVLTMLITVMTGVTLGALSVFLSAIFRRTLSATVTAYGAAFALMLGTLVLGSILSAVAILSPKGATTGLEVHPLLMANPFWSMNAVLNIPSGSAVPLGRLGQLFLMQGGPPNLAGPLVEPWQLTVASELVVTILAIVGAVLQVRGRIPYSARQRARLESEATAGEAEAQP